MNSFKPVSLRNRLSRAGDVPHTFATLLIPPLALSLSSGEFSWWNARSPIHFVNIGPRFFLESVVLACGCC